MSILRKIIMMVVTMLITASIFAQGNDVEMADKMRSNGRIYVVVAVILTILAGLILYVIRIDRKISKMEKETDYKKG